MQYREFGTTGIKISALGFGAMRLPMEDKKGKSYVKEQESIKMIHRAFELGVNYIDTAYPYCDGQSETVVGKALKGWRDKVYVSTKLPTWHVKKRGDYRRFLEEQLKKLDVEYIDFYHYHGLGKDAWDNTIKKLKLLKEARKAKEEDLIKHISFSFHDKGEVMQEIADSGVLETVLCQYNLLDRSNEKAIAYVKKKGLGVVIMGPVGGGRLGVPSNVVKKFIKKGVKTTAEIAIRFVLANPNVSCALSGMNSMAMVEENARVVSREGYLTGKEKEQVKAALKETKKLSDLYCTGCNYCMPCPQDVNIPHNFQLMIYHQVYNLTDFAKQEYKNIGTVPWVKGKKAEECIECYACEDKCPQKIKISKQLKETAKALGGQK